MEKILGLYLAHRSFKFINFHTDTNFTLEYRGS